MLQAEKDKTRIQLKPLQNDLNVLKCLKEGCILKTHKTEKRCIILF